MLHYDTVYLCPSHLDRAASFGSVAVGVGGGVQQLQRRGIGGPWLLAGFGGGEFLLKNERGRGGLRLDFFKTPYSVVEFLGGFMCTI